MSRRSSVLVVSIPNQRGRAGYDSNDNPEALRRNWMGCGDYSLLELSGQLVGIGYSALRARNDASRKELVEQ